MTSYQDFFVATHPTIKTENPTWTPQEITTEIGKRWSLQTMTIGQQGENICIKYSTRKILIDSCGKYNELKLYLESYRTKYGPEKLLKLADAIQSNN